MFEEEDRETGYAVFLAVTLAIVVWLFAIASAIGTAIGQAGGKPAAHSATTPSMLRVFGIVHFAAGKAEPPADVMLLLGPAVRAARASPGSKLAISGYHDASGDAAANAELAKQRAFAVRDALVAAGIEPSRIDLARPSVTLGGGNAEEARRVEVTLR